MVAKRALFHPAATDFVLNVEVSKGDIHVWIVRNLYGMDRFVVFSATEKPWGWKLTIGGVVG